MRAFCRFKAYLGILKEDRWNNQYATVGRPLSPRQRANRRRATRLSPMKSPGKIL